jgi:Gas vesicle synthesis protein GvpL/GvpF
MILLQAIGERDGELVAFVQNGVDQPPKPDEDALRGHDDAVAALMADGPVLPVRFGTVLKREEDLDELLKERESELRARLAHVSGRVEMGVRVTWRDPHPARPRTGRDFMQAKLERVRAARRAADALHPLLQELSVDSVLQLNPREDTAFAGAYLVEKRDIERFAERANSAAAVVTGPWPPYSFSEATVDGG